MIIDKRVIKHGHLYCGIGGGATGFNKAEARVGCMQAEFRCVGGIDVDAGAISSFTKRTGVAGTLLDLFSLDQYVAFHGKQPPSGWREAMPADIVRAFGNDRPHILFLSAPCKGFSGLLSESRSLSAKYQALNALALRGLMLALEAYKDDPIEVILFENVPRIATRGRPLLDQIEGMLSAYGYASAETTHDCGELGGLAQHRNRFLLIARHTEKVPPFIYEPHKSRVRAVGEVLGQMKLPGDPVAGPMHRVPKLHWKTWVRLAFVEAGSDWRSLQKLRVADGVLQDFALVPERDYYAGAFGVHRWDEPSKTVAGESGPSNGAFSVADPRTSDGPSGPHFANSYRVQEWEKPARTVTTGGSPSCGASTIADPRLHPDYESQQYGVNGWNEPANTVTSQRSPGQGRFSVADPRIDGDPRSVQMGVRRWTEPAPAVTASMWAGTGPNSIADPRIEGVKHNNCFRVVRWPDPSCAVTAGTGPSAGGLAVSDPRVGYGPKSHRNKLAIVDWNGPSRTVTCATQVQGGGLSVADPRPENGWHGGKYRVTEFDEAAGTVIAESGTGNGAFAVADPRPRLDPSKREHYLTAGHYGVIPFDQPAHSVTASGQHDNGYHNVADPRLPAPTDRLVAVIRSLDGTWHRPFTTLELAALQSLVEPDGSFDLEGTSDSQWREWIGNAVPDAAARAIASVIGHTLLLAWAGETFALGSTPIWVRPIAVALSVMQRKPM